MTDTTLRPTLAHVRAGRILAVTSAAALAAAGVNTVLRYAAVALLDVPQPAFEPFAPSAVVVSTLVSAAAGGAFFALLTRLTRRPLRVFGIVAAAVLALSMVPVAMLSVADPPQYDGAGVATGMVLALMHVVVAAALFAALRWAHATRASA